MRPELEALPRRMLSLPIDERGYPVPWFVDYVDGKPEFRAMDLEKWARAVRFKLCWVCGQRVGRYMTFVAGAMCGINRTSAEPPCHMDCAEWSARNCPFLSNPEMIRRVDEMVPAAGTCVGGIPLMRNPGVAMLWTTDTYSVLPDGMGGKILHMGEPISVDWYACGKKATREQVMRSIETGLPALEAMAAQEKGGIEHLNELRTRFEKFLPGVSDAGPQRISSP